MKDIKSFQDKYAQENKCDNWTELVEYYIYWDNVKLLFHLDEVAKRFAIEVAKEALRNAAEVVNWNFNGGHDCKQSILNEKNIPKL